MVCVPEKMEGYILLYVYVYYITINGDGNEVTVAQYDFFNQSTIDITGNANSADVMQDGAIFYKELKPVFATLNNKS